MFHFLLNKQDRIKYFEIKYFEVLKESLLPDGIAIINTFAVGGETKCTGLNIAQYDASKTAEELMPRICYVLDCYLSKGSSRLSVNSILFCRPQLKTS